MFQGKQFLNKSSLLWSYYSSIRTYLKQANTAWNVLIGQTSGNFSLIQSMLSMLWLAWHVLNKLVNFLRSKNALNVYKLSAINVHCIKYARIRGFSLTSILPYKDRFYESVLTRENMGLWEPLFLHILCSDISNYA